METKPNFLSPNAWIESRLLDFVRTFGQKCISYSTVACQIQHSFLDGFLCALKQFCLILMMLTSDPYYLLIFYSTTKLSSSFHLMDVFLHEFLSVDFSSIVRSSDELLLFLRYLLHRLIDCFGAFFSSLVNFLPFSSSYARLLLWATHMLIQIVCFFSIVTFAIINYSTGKCALLYFRDGSENRYAYY